MPLIQSSGKDVQCLAHKVVFYILLFAVLKNFKIDLLYMNWAICRFNTIIEISVTGVSENKTETDMIRRILGVYR